jgi:hypothetical protein
MSTSPTFTPLTPKAIETLIQAVTIQALNLPNTAASFYNVRCGWQTQGQPFKGLSEDVVFVRAVERDDPYNRVRDINYVADPNDYTLLNEQATYNRVWEIFYVVYGPNSQDVARQIRSAIFTQTGHDLLVAANLYAVPDLAATRRVPEEQGTGQFWERVDFEILFNEGVVETAPQGTVDSTEVIIVTD